MRHIFLAFKRVYVLGDLLRVSRPPLRPYHRRNCREEIFKVRNFCKSSTTTGRILPPKTDFVHHCLLLRNGLLERQFSTNREKRYSCIDGIDVLIFLGNV